MVILKKHKYVTILKHLHNSTFSVQENKQPTLSVQAFSSRQREQHNEGAADRKSIRQTERESSIKREQLPEGEMGAFDPNMPGGLTWSLKTPHSTAEQIF